VKYILRQQKFVDMYTYFFEAYLHWKWNFDS